MKYNDYDDKLSEAALFAGRVILSSGGETFRAEDTICRILQAGGAQNIEVNAISTFINVTYTSTTGEIITLTKRIVKRGIHMGNIKEANEISRLFCAGSISLDEACARLHQIPNRKGYPAWLVFVCAVFTPAAFTVLLGGNGLDCVVAAMNGVLLAGFTLLNKRLRMPAAVGNCVMGFLIAFASTGVAALMRTHLNSDVLIPGSIMALLPGVTLTNGVHDMLNEDFMSGGARLIEAIVTATTLAVGIGFGLGCAQMLFGGVLA